MIKKSIAIIIAISLLLQLSGCGAPEAQISAPGAASESHTAFVTESASQTVQSAPERQASYPAVTGVSKGEGGYYLCEYDGTERKFMLYIPEGIGEGAPLVFMLHGASGSSMSFMNYTGMNSAAKQYGFAVVYPQEAGVGSAEGGQCWNSGFSNYGNDDTGFLAALARYLQQTYGFSASETFAAGFSDGGFMMYHLACKAFGTFRAVASVSGAMNKSTWGEREETASIGILQINGTNDGVVPVDSPLSSLSGYGGPPPISSVIEYWKNANGLDECREVKLSRKATAYEYSGSGSENLVWYVEIQGGGHEWPKTYSAGFDGSELILEFFSKFVE